MRAIKVRGLSKADFWEESGMKKKCLALGFFIYLVSSWVPACILMTHKNNAQGINESFTQHCDEV